MDTNYDNDVVASLIDKHLEEVSNICGCSVVLRGINLYLLSHDKTITNLSSFVTD